VARISAVGKTFEDKAGRLGRTAGAHCKGGEGGCCVLFWFWSMLRRSRCACLVGVVEQFSMCRLFVERCCFILCVFGCVRVRSFVIPEGM